MPGSGTNIQHKLLPYIFGLIALLITMAFALVQASQWTDPAVENIPYGAVQTAERLPDGTVALTYVYTAPNTCWARGSFAGGQIEDGAISFVGTPDVQDGICGQALTPLDYSRTLSVAPGIEVLIVTIQHPLGGQIEKNELYIIPLSENEATVE